MPKPVAVWNSARDVWETPGTEGFFCEHLDVFLGTFPTSGMTVNGAAYELPTWDPATDGLGSLSLLPTVTTQDGANNGGPSQFDRNTPPLNTRVLMLLKTPTSQLAVNGGSQHPDKRREGGHGPTLADEIEHLLPTPTVGMMLGGSQTRSGARNGEKLLPGVAKDLALLPTPAAIDGNGTGNAQSLGALKTGGRQLHTTDIPRLLDLSTGESTTQPSDAGNAPSDGQLRGQLNLLDAITDTD